MGNREAILQLMKAEAEMGVLHPNGEGSYAQQLGEPIGANPYDPASPEGLAWTSGWRRAAERADDWVTAATAPADGEPVDDWDADEPDDDSIL